MLHSLQHTVDALGLVAEVQRVDHGVWSGPGSNLFPYDSGLFPFPLSSLSLQISNVLGNLLFPTLTKRREALAFLHCFSPATFDAA